MLDFYLIYNKISSSMKFLEPIYLGKTKVPFKFSNWIVGSVPYLMALDLPDLKKYKTKFTFAKIASNRNDLSCIFHMYDHDKFFMDTKGNIYTTPTGLIFMKYFHLIPISLGSACFAKNLDFLHKRTIIYPSILGNYTYLFLIKKQFKIPKPVFNIILLELCKLHFVDYDMYICKCKRVLDTNFTCRKCHVCVTCKKKITDIYKCRCCGKNYCKSHLYKYETCLSCLK